MHKIHDDDVQLLQTTYLYNVYLFKHVQYYPIFLIIFSSELFQH